MAVTLVALLAAIHGVSAAAVSVIVGGQGEPHVAAIPSSYSLEEEQAFEDFIAKHRHGYRRGTVEHQQRQALFTKRRAEVEAHNAGVQRLWTAGVSRFSDRSDEERKALRGWRHLPHRHSSHGGSMLETAQRQPGAELPEEVSWRHLSVANKIRDQGSCGSCWAIATTSVLEAHYELYMATSADDALMFSPQRVLDCTPNPHECGGRGGCEGATAELAMAWVVQHGTATEDQEPYRGADGTCQGGQEADSEDDQGTSHTSQLLGRSSTSTLGGAAIGLHGFQTLESNAALPLRMAVAQYGPVAVSAAAGDWFEYHEGIFDGCSKDALVDHTITLYGYGIHQDSGTKYWLIKNSWGFDWGERGFIRLLRHDDDEDYCGTDNDPSQGSGCKGGPDHVRVCGMCGILYDSVVPFFKGRRRSEASESQGTATRHVEGPEAFRSGELPDEERRSVAHGGMPASWLRREITAGAEASPVRTASDR